MIGNTNRRSAGLGSYLPLAGGPESKMTGNLWMDWNAVVFDDVGTVALLSYGASTLSVSLGGQTKWKFLTTQFGAFDKGGAITNTVGPLADWWTTIAVDHNNPTYGLGGVPANEYFTLVTGSKVNAQLSIDVAAGAPWKMYFDMKGSLSRKTSSAEYPTGITASTTQTQGQMPLNADINEITTVTNANDVVTLPNLRDGLEPMVINHGANTLQIFPKSGQDAGAGVDTSVTLAAGKVARFVTYKAGAAVMLADN